MYIISQEAAAHRLVNFEKTNKVFVQKLQLLVLRRDHKTQQYKHIIYVYKLIN